ncbi:flavin-containing monooxygenase 5-like [Pelobates fuscus]|uniref:flavin-containing monooxygenase 5-like n=1 Tax=Pelobates fuscus TaxID=191477 RepID=UPI002FE4CDC0
MVKSVAIIGAGSSGMSAIKCCLDEGLEPTCYEKTDDVGGLWRYKDKPEDDRASIYQSVVINTSKEMMCFSDYPIPDDFPNFMHHSKVMEYFRMYAQNFNLIKYIQFKTTVYSIKKRPNFTTTGKWIVIIECDGEQERRVFDAVMVCTGHHSTPYLPLHSFPGIEMFKGQYIHSRNYKTPYDFQGKKVLVIGIGNSGVDIAVELSRTAERVFLSTRKGAWIVNRISDGGYPVDIVHLSRFSNTIENILPSFLINYIAESSLNKRFNHTNYGIVPKHR